MTTPPSADVLQRSLERERKARQNVESLLEGKTRELYLKNQELEKQYKELKLAQAKLVQSEKMASLGTMAAGVAHEINNPIGFVLSNIETLTEYCKVLVSLSKHAQSIPSLLKNKRTAELSKLAQDIDTKAQEEDLAFVYDDIDNLLKESVEGAHRVKEIVQGLKTFSRFDDDKSQNIDLNQTIEGTLKVIWNELKHKCEIIKDLDPIPEVECHEGQLKQVFVNLLVNSSQAIEKNGKIWIQTRHNGDEIELRFKDNGCGIPEEKIQEIFDPFFTTKPVGQGTGLGLSVSHEIIKAHHGSIDVLSTPGEGTEFIIRLPAS